MLKLALQPSRRLVTIADLRKADFRAIHSTAWLRYLQEFRMHLVTQPAPLPPRGLIQHNPMLATGTGRRVMVIEDDDDIRETLVDVLEGEGYSVESAANGREALTQLEHERASERPCVILLDLMMPVMNGWQFMTAHNDDDELASIPVVVVSATPHRPPLASAYVTKPLDVDSLLNVLEELCS